jgi:hypothetical protein
MIATLIIVLLILALGTRAGDALEVRQQEIVLAKLSIPAAHDYYQRLRRRAWRARVLRGVAVLALITLAYAARRLLPVTRLPDAADVGVREGVPGRRGGVPAGEAVAVVDAPGDAADL